MPLMYFLKLEGIEGESQDDKYVDHIELLSWSYGANNTGSFQTGSGGGTGKVTFHDATFTHYLDKASPNLALYCAAGKHITTATLNCIKVNGADKLEYFKVVFTDVRITSVQTGGHTQGDLLPTEQFSLNYASIQWVYQPQGNTGDPAGNIEAGWDVQKQKAAA